VIMNQDDRGGPLGDRFPEHLARMDERGTQQPPRDRDVALEPVLGIQDRNVELLHRQVLQARAENPVHV
jgi:hypothetical protein